MLVAISINNAAHQKEHGEAFKHGFERHSIQTVMVQGDEVHESADIHVIWSVKRPNILAWSKRTGRHLLVAERGHVGDRMHYTSVGWNGLGHRGTYAKAKDGGERWQRWSHLLQPWKGDGGYALVLGQCTGDASLYGLVEGFQAWANTQCQALRKAGYAVMYRPHPLMVRQGFDFCPPSAFKAQGATLFEDLKGAALAVTFNSTSGVESVLAGVPTVTMDIGAMAWPVSGHTLFDRVKPAREDWCHDLAWSQFAIEEIRSGFAWESVKDAIPH